MALNTQHFDVLFGLAEFRVLEPRQDVMRFHLVELKVLTANRAIPFVLVVDGTLDVLHLVLVGEDALVAALAHFDIAEGDVQTADAECALPCLALWRHVSHDNGAVVVDGRFHVSVFCFWAIGGTRTHNPVRLSADSTIELLSHVDVAPSPYDVL